MDLTTYVENLRSELADAAELGGEEARALAQRLTGPMESAVRLALLEALSAAADEITRDLAPGSVQLRLHGREPTFVVTPPQAEPPPEPAVTEPALGSPDAEEGALTRISFRLPDQLKSRIEDAAAREGLSVNAWLIRAATAAVQAPAAPRVAGRAPRGAQRYTGWVR
ncbi:hypothetical protein [Micromonospora sp. DT233]|uniref:hypothetical protein n=1 Tax=Micromonospora sp. DT233 TaxID=3393432 RepID=UPI003CEAA4F9